MIRHVAALALIAVAGWLALIDALPSCVPDDWNQCGEQGPGVPDAVLVPAIAAALTAVQLMKPWRGRTFGVRALRSTAWTVMPAFLPFAVAVPAAVLLSESPAENGRELLTRIEQKLERGPSFQLEPIQEWWEANLLVLPPQSSPDFIRTRLGLPWEAADEVADRSERRQLWIIAHGDEVVAWLRLPERLDGGCVRPSWYGYHERFAATAAGHITVEKRWSGRCRVRAAPRGGP